MVDWPAIAIFAREESIIADMPRCFDARVCVLHIILISSAFFDSRHDRSVLRDDAARNVRWSAARKRVTPQQLVSNLCNPRFIKRGR